MSKYQAKEAFSVMQYKCDKCGNHEEVFNIRDSVTPFGFGCVKCKEGTMSHVNWNMDTFMGEDFKPSSGSLMMIYLTPETALERAKKRVESADGTEYELSGKEREEMIYSLTNSFMEDCCSCEIVRAK